MFRDIFKESLQKRLVLGFLVATCLTGMVATFVGIKIINRNTMDEAQRRVQQDINTARLICKHNMERLAFQVRCIALRSHLGNVVSSGDVLALEDMKGLIRTGVDVKNGQRTECMCLDMLSLVDAEGTVLYRASNPAAKGDTVLWDPVIRECLAKKTLLSSTELIPLEWILRENPLLSERLQTAIVETPWSIETGEKELSEGMVLRAAYPIFDSNGDFKGALVGGVLLNGDYAIVDKITETVFRDEKYKDRDMGFATIFQGGVRISTNVMTRDSERAIGTVVSREVYEKVIEEGKDWVGRAFVVNDWYLSSYVPIYNIGDNIIGMLYVGILEAKYRDMKLFAMWIFLGITTLGMIIAFIISFWMGQAIMERMRILKQATETIATGDLDYQLPSSKSSDFGVLDKAFNDMVRSLKDRDDRLKKAFEQLTQTKRLISLGQIAAGVAHEMNNPLGGILLYSSLVLEELPEDNLARENINKIIYQTNRCKEIVQNLLDFARTPSGEMMSIDINNVLLTSLSLVKDQSMFHGIEIEISLTEDLPQVNGDRSRLEQIFLSLFINAADSMAEGGKLTVATKLISRFPSGAAESMEMEKICLLASAHTIKITISDTGKGIEKVHLAHIFEPFFTTKDPGQGTGLGLSIAYGIVRKHDGFIDVESEPGQGTTFSIFLPAREVDSPERNETAEDIRVG
ncbi:MAG: cache domain-containing protein [Thermodesulfobacteriota bacterium]|nr:cache domain-containing protein [Thermodesulfobacteriota bacterium]